MLRAWRRGDEDALVAIADDRAIWLGVRDRFPSPYTREAAEEWIASQVERGEPARDFAIVVDGELAGGIGLVPGEDVYRCGAEIGYWVGRAWWGRGIATDAVSTMVDHAFGELGLERLEARVFESNPRSWRVLEKAGFRREGRLARSVVKAGRVMDSLLYARVAAPRPSQGS